MKYVLPTCLLFIHYHPKPKQIFPQKMVSQMLIQVKALVDFYSF